MINDFNKWPVGQQINLYNKAIPILNGTVLFRSMDLDRDLEMVHEWVNRDYAKTFWQMRGSLGLLRACYQCIQQNPFSHSFIGEYLNEPVCQFDIYAVSADELAKHIQYEENDMGFHLLMSPITKPVHGLTVALIKAFLEFYFQHPDANIMYAEPDIQNDKSVRLLEICGFRKVKTIEMSYKTALVYSLTKTEFHAPLPHH